jgi:SAM-dependent methyltransferase
MFTHKGLHTIRRHEIAFLSRYLPTGARVLELGAGTGFQAQELDRLGFAVSAIDIQRSSYANDRVFDVADYDGIHIPFPDGTFDAVLTSNVLEHVSDLTPIFRDIRRVLRPNGFCVHAMPTPTWRLWTNLCGPIDAIVFSVVSIRDYPKPTIFKFVRGLLSRTMPRKHGHSGNAFSELWTYRRARWYREFERNGFEIIEDQPMGLFYTGWMVLGPRWSLASRGRAARMFGSSCRAYVVRPDAARSS